LDNKKTGEAVWQKILQVLELTLGGFASLFVAAFALVDGFLAAHTPNPSDI
jgi:uncharacterized membrane protein